MLHICSNDTASTLTEVQDVDVQPNACDLRVDKIFSINPNVFLINEEKKVHRGSTELQPDHDGYWHLDEGTYEIVMQNIISVGEGEAGWVITRSTLNRNGVFITSGLYDSGYHGVMAGALHVTCGPMKIQRGTRVGQFLLFKSQTLKMYNGDYGIGKQHDTKYINKKGE
jgi:deoxycytidine triphosphate deaminase